MSRRVGSGLRVGVLLGLFAAASPGAAAESAGGLSQADKDAVLKLTLLLGSEEWSVRSKAEKRLLKAGRRAVPYLCEFLETGPEDLPRARVVKLLEEIGDKRALKSVTLMSTRERPAEVRVCAVRALTKIGGKGVDKYLVRLLRDKQILVAQTAFQGLTKLIHARLSDPSGFGELGDLLLDELPDAKGRARIWIVGLLGTMGEKRAARALVRLAGSESRQLRLSALDALARVAERDAAPAVVELLGKDWDERSQRKVIAVLGSLGNEDIVPDLISLMKEKPHLARDLADATSRITGQHLGPSPHAWSMWWANKYAGDKVALQVAGAARAPRAAAAGPAAMPGAPAPAPGEITPPRESRPTGPTPEERRRRSYIIWAVMGAALVIAACGLVVYARKSMPQDRSRRRKKTR